MAALSSSHRGLHRPVGSDVRVGRRGRPNARERIEERTPMSVVKDNPAKGRFEMTSGDVLAVIEYRRADDRIVLTHTEVPDVLAGQGVGSRLVRGVLDTMRAEGTKVVPRCEFVAAFIARHPEYQDLVAQD
jgi:uncharacterized protein